MRTGIGTGREPAQLRSAAESARELVEVRRAHVVLTQWRQLAEAIPLGARAEVVARSLLRTEFAVLARHGEVRRAEGVELRVLLAEFCLRQLEQRPGSEQFVVALSGDLGAAHRRAPRDAMVARPHGAPGRAFARLFERRADQARLDAFGGGAQPGESLGIEGARTRHLAAVAGEVAFPERDATEIDMREELVSREAQHAFEGAARRRVATEAEGEAAVQARGRGRHPLQHPRAETEHRGAG